MRGYAFLQELGIPENTPALHSEEDLNKRISKIRTDLSKYYKVENLDRQSAQTSLEKALQGCHALIEQYRGCGEAYLIRGVVHDEKNEWTAAIKDLREAHAHHIPRAGEKLAQVYSKQGQHQYNQWYDTLENPVFLEEAENNFSKAIELLPSRASFYFARGIVRDVQGQTKSAYNDLTKALELDPNHEPSAFARGCMYLRHGMFREALKDLAHALNHCTNAENKKNIQEALRYTAAGVPMNMPRIKLNLEKTYTT